MRRIHHESIASDHLTSNHLETDRLTAVNSDRKPAPFEALSLPRPDTAATLALRRFGSSVRILRGFTKRIERGTPPKPLPAAFPASSTIILETMVTGALFKRVGLENGAAHGLRRHGRARH